MMHMYPYISLNPFEGESSYVQAQGFAFQQFQRQQNWNLYNNWTIDSFITETNNNTINVFGQADQGFSQYNFQKSLNINHGMKNSNHIYSNFTIPSITSIISPQQQITTNNVNIMDFLPSLPSSNNMLTPSSVISSIPSIPLKSSIEIDFNYNENSDLLIQPQPQNSTQSSDALSYFATPDKDTAISLQDIIDGMEVVKEISNDWTTHNSNLDCGLLQSDVSHVTDNLVTDLDENSIDWFIQEMSKQAETYEKGELSEKQQDEKFYQDIDCLIEEHMKEIKKVVHNEILCQEILAESPSLEYQDLNMADGTSQTEVGSSNSSLMSSTATTTTINNQDVIIIKQEGASQETVLVGSLSSASSSASSSLSSSNMFMLQENNFSYDMITNSTNRDSDQRTLKCNEVGCSKEYNCYAKLKSHKITHTNDKPFMCNVLGCNKKFKRSGELIKHQLDHLN